MNNAAHFDLAQITRAVHDALAHDQAVIVVRVDNEIRAMQRAPHPCPELFP